jgi:hypothetical protein
VSAFFDLYDTHNTTYHTSDDTLVTSSGNTFKRLSLRDSELDVEDELSASDCTGEGWHNGWWQLASGLSGNRTYRLHVHSTDKDNPSDQLNTTALNSFAIWAKASGGTPRSTGSVMEAYTIAGRAHPSSISWIDAEHAGKTMSSALGWEIRNLA